MLYFFIFQAKDVIRVAHYGLEFRRLLFRSFGSRAYQISLLYVLHYIHSAGSYTLLESMDGGSQQDRIDGGSQAFSLALRSKLGDSVRLARDRKSTRLNSSH